MSNVYDLMKAKGIELPNPPGKGGIYTPALDFGSNLIYCSGCGPALDNGETVIGKLGGSLTVEEGQHAAYNCMLNLLANLHARLGDLNRITKFVKVLAFVNSTEDFSQQPQVINGGSQLLVDLFGEEVGCPARTAVGVNALPGGIAVEIEVLVQYQ